MTGTKFLSFISQKYIKNVNVFRFQPWREIQEEPVCSSWLYLVAHPHHCPLMFATSPLLHIHPSYTKNALLSLHSASLPYLELKSTNTQLAVWLQMEPQHAQWKDPSLRELKPRAEWPWHCRRHSWKQVKQWLSAMPCLPTSRLLWISHSRAPRSSLAMQGMWISLLSPEPQPLGARSRSVSAALSPRRWS